MTRCTPVVRVARTETVARADIVAMVGGWWEGSTRAGGIWRLERTLGCKCKLFLGVFDGASADIPLQIVR